MHQLQWGNYRKQRPHDYADHDQGDANILLGRGAAGIPCSAAEGQARSAIWLSTSARRCLWQEAFAEAVRCRRDTDDKAYCTVVVGHLGEKRWLYGDDMMEYANKYRYTKDAIERGARAIVNAVAIFGKGQVRAWCGGIPQVFYDGTEADVKEILYPEGFVDWKGTRLENWV